MRLLNRVFTVLDRLPKSLQPSKGFFPKTRARRLGLGAQKTTTDAMHEDDFVRISGVWVPRDPVERAKPYYAKQIQAACAKDQASAKAAAALTHLRMAQGFYGPSFVQPGKALVALDAPKKVRFVVA